MTEIWFVEDFLNGGVIGHRYFSTEAEAVDFRNPLGYGLIKSLKLQDGGVVPKRDKTVEIA